MSYKVGNYHIGRRGNKFALYKIHAVTATGGYSSAFDSNELVFDTIEEAREKMYQLNGWRLRK